MGVQMQTLSRWTCLCARGNKQLEGTDFFDTYANDPKTLIALEVREDSVVESPADPKLEPPINPRDKPMVDNP